MADEAKLSREYLAIVLAESGQDADAFFDKMAKALVHKDSKELAGEFDVRRGQAAAFITFAKMPLSEATAPATQGGHGVRLPGVGKNGGPTLEEKEAKQGVSTAARQEPDECANWVQMAKNFLRAGRPKKAIMYAEKILEKNPDSRFADEARRIRDQARKKGGEPTP